MYQIAGANYQEQHRFSGSFENTASQMDRLLTHFEPISLSDMKNVALLKRTDTKYVMGVSQLQDVLRQIGTEYRVLDIQGVRLHQYQTVYFDTDDLLMYRQHHNGLRNRYKVRLREYVDTEMAFWEVKRKNNRNSTIKSRMQTSEIVPDIEGAVDDFVHEYTPIEPQQLDLKLWNEFLRMTLVSKTRLERLTLDINVSFGHGDLQTAMPGIAIAEVKQEHFTQDSDFIRQMRLHGIRPNRFSKYCAGIYSLYDDVKTNNFKTRIRLVNELMKEEVEHEYAH
jgi:hypothetical protein